MRKCVKPFLSSREQGEIMEPSGVNEVSGQIFQPVENLSRAV